MLRSFTESVSLLMAPPQISSTISRCVTLPPLPTQEPLPRRAIISPLTPIWFFRRRPDVIYFHQYNQPPPSRNEFLRPPPNASHSFSLPSKGGRFPLTGNCSDAGLFFPFAHSLSIMDFSPKKQTFPRPAKNRLDQYRSTSPFFG